MNRSNGIRKRYGISERQKQALRKAKTQHPNWTQVELQHWFRNEFGRPTAQSSVSEILGNHYYHLDNGKLSKIPTYRHPRVNHPSLEKALCEYVDRVNAQKMTVNGDLIIEAAAFLWRKMPEYEGLPEPKWSQGWLAKFKKMHNSKQRRLYGESASVDVEKAAGRLLEIQEIVKEYDSKDIYNCDETGLFWRMIPQKTLSRCQHKGSKVDKARITAHLTCNADGSHKLDPWLIGNSKNPRAFGRQNQKIKAMPFIYRFNKKAWMTGEIFANTLSGLIIKWLGARCFFSAIVFPLMKLLSMQLLTEKNSGFAIHGSNFFQPMQPLFISRLTKALSIMSRSTTASIGLPSCFISPRAIETHAKR